MTDVEGKWFTPDTKPKKKRRKARKCPISTTQCSIDLMVQRGYEADRCERVLPGIFRKFDLFGVADIVAFGNQETFLIQTTTADNRAARREKIKASGKAFRWMRGQGRSLLLHAWRPLPGKERSHLRENWVCVEEEIFSGTDREFALPPKEKAK